MTATPEQLLKEEIDALKSVIDSARNECDASDGKRWSYYTKGGWAGDRLRSLLARLESAASPAPGTRALIEAKREGFMKGTKYSFSETSVAERRAAELYPMPKRPLRVTFSNGGVWSMEPRCCDDAFPFVCHTNGGVRSPLSTVNLMLERPDDYRAMLRLLSGEQEEVDAESAVAAPPAGQGSRSV